MVDTGSNQRRRALRIGSAMATSFLVAAVGSAQPLDSQFRLEWSAVTLAGIHDTWRLARAEVARSVPERYQTFLAAEHHSRFHDDALALIAGGFRRLGASTVSGHVGLGGGSGFLYRSSLELEGWHEVWPRWVPHLSYRYLHFQSTDVQLLSPAITHYSRDGEIESRVFFSRNGARDVTDTTYLVRGIWNRTSRIRFGGGVAVGKRIFDVAALADGEGRGFVIFADGRVRVSKRSSLGLHLSAARESPRFRQRSVGFSYGLTR